MKTFMTSLEVPPLHIESQITLLDPWLLIPNGHDDGLAAERASDFAMTGAVN